MSQFCELLANIQHVIYMNYCRCSLQCFSMFVGTPPRCLWVPLMNATVELTILSIYLLILRQDFYKLVNSIAWITDRTRIFLFFNINIVSFFVFSDPFEHDARVMQNKCNVGYAFINMVDPSHIVPLYEVCFLLNCILVHSTSVFLPVLCVDYRSLAYFDRISLSWQTLNGKKWEKFNSEKVASLAYARIQGKAALVAHFQNSSLMNEDKRCRPILFHSDGTNAGDQV